MSVDQILAELVKINQVLQDFQLSTKRVLTLDEVVRFTGLKRSTIYQKSSKGEIPCYRQGGTLFFDRLEIEKWMLQNKKSVKPVR